MDSSAPRRKIRLSVPWGSTDSELETGHVRHLLVEQLLNQPLINWHLVGVQPIDHECDPYF